jgi:hypothetical protein
MIEDSMSEEKSQEEFCGQGVNFVRWSSEKVLKDGSFRVF